MMNMVAFFSQLFAAALLLATTIDTVKANDVQVGDEVCAGGYIMDWYCIKLGNLLDTGDVTLENPERHSYHCLLDVGQCVNSPFEILQDKTTPDGLYGRWYQASNNDLLLHVGRKEGEKGYCSTCLSTDNSARSRGFRAEVKGTVIALADGETPPILNITQSRLLAQGTDPCLNPDEGEWTTLEDISSGDDDDDDNSTSSAFSTLENSLQVMTMSLSSLVIMACFAM